MRAPLVFRVRNFRGFVAKPQVLRQEPVWNRRGTRRNLCRSSGFVFGTSEDPSQSHRFCVRNPYGTAAEPAGTLADPQVSRKELKRNRCETIGFA